MNARLSGVILVGSAVVIGASAALLVAVRWPTSHGSAAAPTLRPVLVAVSASRPRQPTVAPCDEDLARRAAIHELPSDLNLYGIESSFGEIAAHRRRLENLRACVSTITDKCARDAYVHWLDYDSSEIDRAEDRLRHPEPNAEDTAREHAEALARDRWMEKTKFPKLACGNKDGALE